uniref:S1 motif domain-containing protein n=1 Tax=Cryptomonas curvata TaxID=233186 RepID=A0A7S0MNZ6_9CRYP|nr:translational initiation factor 2 alpha SU [Cryptomonas curvata]|mmetsp:Transcript_50551/g.105601  ORF Transcript_50551/g.105601 Transcript_50551/m.105601 type:complete len:267 (+) Transcript_50551:932-1732(+)
MDIRTYEHFYPIVGNVTIVLIKEIIEMGAYVQLLEFDNTQGMLMMSEISRRKIRSLNKLIKIGKTEVIMIIRVDYEKGYIDVSKRQILENEILYMEKKWNYSKNVNSITSHLSRCVVLNCEDSKIRWIWLLYRKYGHAIRGIKKSANNSNKTFIGLDIFQLEEIKLLKILEKKIIQASNNISVEFELFIFSKNGIKVTKKLIEQQLKTFKEKQIEVRMIVPPVFAITLYNETKKTGIKTIMGVLSNISQSVKKKNGSLIVKKLNLK